MARRRRSAEDVPLEARSRLDWAWYDVTVGMEGSKLRIQFQGFSAAHDEIWDGNFLRDADRITDLIRLRSKQLQDFDCAKIQKNMIVCAIFRSADGSELKYYDAKVVQVRRKGHLHSAGRQEETCVCEFLLEWAEGAPIRRRVSVGCGEISIIDDGSIDIHPVLSELLQEARRCQKK